MSAAAQIINVEKLIAKWLGDVAELKTEAIDREQNGLDATVLRARLTDVEAIVEYLTDIHDALHIAVPEQAREA